MRFNTSINNVKCLEWGINANQGALFDLLYQASSWADTVILDNEVYYHVSRNLVIEELPLYYDKPDTVYRHLKDLDKKGLIVYRKEGKNDIMKLTEKGKEWNKMIFYKFFKKMTNNNMSNISFWRYLKTSLNKIGIIERKDGKAFIEGIKINPEYEEELNQFINNNNVEEKE